MTKPLFSTSLNQAESERVILYEIYKNNVVLIDDLKNTADRFREELANIEDDISLGDGSGKMEKEAAGFLNAMLGFNEEMSPRCEKFNELVEKMIKHYNECLSAYDAKEGELSSLLGVRKKMLFLILLVRKFKQKIVSLQLLNQALLSLSPEMSEAKLHFKSNLVFVNSSMSAAIEATEHLVNQIESIN